MVGAMSDRLEDYRWCIENGLDPSLAGLTITPKEPPHTYVWDDGEVYKFVKSPMGLLYGLEFRDPWVTHQGHFDDPSTIEPNPMVHR